MSPQPPAETSYTFGAFRLDVRAKALFHGDDLVGLGSRAVSLLRVLLQHPGLPVSKDVLIEQAWSGLAVEEGNLATQMTTLRKALGVEPGGERWIETLPRRGYRYVGPAVTGGPATPARSSIAVLPFADLSDHTAHHHFGDAIADDIIMALTRFKWFTVVARNTSFAFRDASVDVRQVAARLGVRYLVAGSYRSAGGRIRVTAQLIEAATGGHIWAERYERDLSDVFAIQDDITDHVVGAIEPELLKSETGPAALRHGDMQTAWNLVRQGVLLFHRVAREPHEQARRLFQTATKLDPSLPEAHIWLARVCGGIGLWGWSDRPEAVIQEGLTAAMTAVRLDAKNPYAHYGLAITSCAAHRLDQAVHAAHRIIELSSSFALGHLVLGMAHLYAGRAQEARDALRQGLRLNAYDPHNFAWFDLLALAHLFLGERDLALAAADKALESRPEAQMTLEVAALCCAQIGQTEKAARHFDAMRRATDSTSNLLEPLKYLNPEWSRRLDALSKQ